VNFPFLIENCQKESLASLPSAGEPEDLVKRVKPRRRNEESSVREKEGDLLLTLTDESCSPLKRRGIATGNRVPERGRGPVLINGRKKSTRSLFFPY
jgi:hypothetical protein